MTGFKRFSSFDANKRLPEFRKNKKTEKILDAINNNLLPMQKQFEKKSSPQNNSIILIIGLPRSGSTFLLQLMASRLDLGYVSNLMARFYLVPSVGAFFQSQLIGDRYHTTRSYHSIHGKTKDIEEPNEFGYFWSRHFSVCEDEVHEPTKNELKRVDIAKLNRELQSVLRVFDKSVVFKCPLGAFFIPILTQISNIFFIDLQRNLSNVARSIMKVRIERMGSPSVWWSIRPKSYHKLIKMDPEQQINGQIISIRKAIKEGLQSVDEKRRFTIKYEDLVQDPDCVLDRLILKIKKFGFKLEKVEAAPKNTDE